ncbi:hypothetical protein LO762_30225 [Actinocorallia sp. API 0066]|uniref:hypothetical protein n=1 Tax=Actinocorallia sp. API 0066 TaxID=2896846 RepID=UPI001E3AD16B|nr:hypothetical protein [Actinocorallia sp. API 0066]MCD0453427.1 hypothetical protein [Actinocorallia sp. API 0066]
MRFTWLKTDGTKVQVDTAVKSDRTKGAANYLAKNVALVCAGDLARYSEARRWLGTFRLDDSQAAQRRHQATRDIKAFLRRAVEVRYADLYELAMEDEDATEAEQAAAELVRQMKNAAQAYAARYEAAILTSRPLLNPLVVRNDEVLAEVQPRDPADVVNALLSLPSGPAPGRVWTRDELRFPIARALDRLYPLGRSWIEPSDLEDWHTALYRDWAAGLHLLPLARPTAVPATLPVQLPPGQPSPGQSPPGQLPPGQSQPGQPSPVQAPPGQPSPVQVPAVVSADDGMEVEEAEPLGDPHDPELVQPAPRTSAQDERQAEVLASLRSLLDRPMAKLKLEERESLITLRAGHPTPDLLNLSSANAERLRELYTLVADRCALTPQRAERWAETLKRDGFDLRDLPATIDRLRSEGQMPQVRGYEFQIRQTLEAWSEYRLSMVEAKLPGDTQPWPRHDRFIDTLEWVAPGEFRFREYKSYNAALDLPPKWQASFIDQSDDYWAAIFGNPFGYPVEYVFEQGVPRWARTALTANAPYFAYGLHLTNLQTNTTERL